MNLLLDEFEYQENFSLNRNYKFKTETKNIL